MMRKVLLGLLSVLALAVLALVAYLLPAHLEIREIRPPLPSDASLLSLLEADDKPIHVSAILTSSQRSPERSLGHHTIVIEWADGRIFLIDAGMDEANAVEFGKLLESMWGADPAVFHTTTFDALGDQADQVAAVGFTHLHIDHTQGVAQVCTGDPSFVVVQSTQQRTIHNMNTEEGAAVVASCPQSPAINADALVELDGFPGLGMYTLAGHTPGSTLFVVAWRDQILLFPGDITNSKAELLEDQGKGFFYSYLAVPEDTTRTASLRAWLRALDTQPNMHVFVSHDLEDMETLNALWGD